MPRVYELRISKAEHFIPLSRVPELTSLAVHPILEGELSEEAALSVQEDAQEHFSEQSESTQNAVLKRLTSIQTHKAYLEKQIRCGVIKVLHRDEKIPLDVAPEDMPSQAVLFKHYVINQDELIKFATLLSIKVLIELEDEQEDSRGSKKTSTIARNLELQAAAEKLAQEYAAANKPKLTRRKAATELAKKPGYSDTTPETIERILRKTW